MLTVQRYAQQAIDYYNVISACMQVERCKGMTVWDFDDQVRSHNPPDNVAQANTIHSTLGSPLPSPARVLLTSTTVTSAASPLTRPSPTPSTASPAVLLAPTLSFPLLKYKQAKVVL